MYYYPCMDVKSMKKLTGKILSGVLALTLSVGMSSSAFAGAIMYGDVTGDRNVNSADALGTLKHSVGLETLKGAAFTSGDVNGDGKVDSSDALDILLYSVGKITSFKAESSSALKMYTDAIKNARDKRPAYRIKTGTTIGKADVNVSDPLGLLILAGTSAKEIETEMKNELLSQQAGSSQTFCKKGSASSFNNLPLLCKITDTSKFLSLSAKPDKDGNYKIEIKFKDEKNPSAGSVICSVLGMTTYDEMLSELENSMEIEEGVSVKVNLEEYNYKNASLSCTVNPDTGEISDMKWSTDIEMKYSSNMLVGINVSMETTVTADYWDFDY